MKSAFILLLIFGCIGTINTYECHSCSGSDCADPYGGTTKVNVPGA
ncbi:unnamed protein product, partial [Adineta steineri]